MEVVFPHNGLNKLTKFTGKEQLLENPLPLFPPFSSPPNAICGKPHPETTRVPICTLAQSWSIQELTWSRISSENTRKKELRKRSTISSLRRTKHPANKEHWYQAASKVTQDDKQFTLRSSNPWTRTHTKNTRLTKKEKFEFYQPLNGCVICFNTIPKQYIKTVTTSGTGRERRQDLRRGCARTVKEIIDDGTVENNISTSVAKAIAKDTLLEGNSVRYPQLAPNLETLDLQNKGTFLRRTKRPQRGVAALSAAWTLSQAQRSMFVGRATELVERRRGASIAPEGFACIQGLMKPEIRRKKLERQHLRTQQNTAAVRQGQEPSPTGRYKRCQHWKHQDGRWTRSIAKVSDTMDVQEHLVKCGIMLRPLGPKPIQNTNAEKAEREGVWRGWRIANVDNSGRAADVTERRIPCSLLLDEEIFFRWQKPRAKFGTTDDISEEREDKTQTYSGEDWTR